MGANQCMLMLKTYSLMSHVLHTRNVVQAGDTTALNQNKTPTKLQSSVETFSEFVELYSFCYCY
eukprot:m.148234 g.148234  ORF g.148234 m.148234 type:complete len:64 (+) comp24383_c0_seq1:97-288(+)